MYLREIPVMAGEMSQQSTTLALLPKDPESIPNTHIELQSSVALVLGDLTPSSDLHENQACTCWQTLQGINKILELFLN